MSFSIGNQPVYLLGTAAAPVTTGTTGAWVTLPGPGQSYRAIVLEGVPNGASVVIQAANSLRTSNVIAVTDPSGNPLTFTVAEMVEMPSFPTSAMVMRAVLSSAGGSTSLRCYVV